MPEDMAGIGIALAAKKTEWMMSVKRSVKRSIERNVITSLMVAGSIAASCGSTALAQKNTFPPPETFPPVFGEHEATNYCLPLIRKIPAGERNTALQDCVTQMTTAFQSRPVSTGTPNTPGAPAQAQVCDMPQARRQLIDPANEEAPFTLLDAMFRRTVARLNEDGAKSNPDLLRRFALARNPDAQKSNLELAKTLLENGARDFNAGVKSWAAAASEACSDCAVIERWTILKSAANLIAKSWDFFGPVGSQGRQYAVGPDPRDAQQRFTLMYTDQITPNQESNLRLQVGTQPSDLTKLNSDPRNANLTKSYSLNAVTDKWVSALDGTLIEGLARAVCVVSRGDQAKREGGGAYNNAHLYFRYARDVQERINNAFGLGYFEDANNADRPSKGRAMAVVASSAGTLKCGEQVLDENRFEMRAFQPSHTLRPYGEELNFTPSRMCDRWFRPDGTPR